MNIAVIYHTDSHRENGENVGDMYRRMIRLQDRMLPDSFDKAYLLTADDYNLSFIEPIKVEGLNRNHIMYNREVTFRNFMRTAEEGNQYVFMEPDQIWHKVPVIERDLALVHRRRVGPHLCPAVRIAKASALPIFEWWVNRYEEQDYQRDWHGDSRVFADLYKALEEPDILKIKTFEGVSIQFLDYNLYINAKHHSTKRTFARNFKGNGPKVNFFKFAEEYLYGRK